MPPRHVCVFADLPLGIQSHVTLAKPHRPPSLLLNVIYIYIYTQRITRKYSPDAKSTLHSPVPGGSSLTRHAPLRYSVGHVAVGIPMTSLTRGDFPRCFRLGRSSFELSRDGSSPTTTSSPSLFSFVRPETSNYTRDTVQHRPASRPASATFHSTLRPKFQLGCISTRRTHDAA